MTSFQLNGKQVETGLPTDTPLLWVIREEFKLTGSKFGCGAGLCGACTIHLDGAATRSCVLPLAAVANRSVTTIEGLGDENKPHPVQQAWVEHSVSQCGYCQSGQIMSASALLDSNPQADDQAIDAAMSGNICRCGTYPEIRKAIKSAGAVMAVDATAEAIS